VAACFPGGFGIPFGVVGWVRCFSSAGSGTWFTGTALLCATLTGGSGVGLGLVLGYVLGYVLGGVRFATVEFPLLFIAAKPPAAAAAIAKSATPMTPTRFFGGAGETSVPTPACVVGAASAVIVGAVAAEVTAGDENGAPIVGAVASTGVGRPSTVARRALRISRAVWKRSPVAFAMALRQAASRD
jgi:hypothetical protein